MSDAFFSNVYTKKLWAGHQFDLHGGSGTGSIPEVAFVTRYAIGHIVVKYNIKNILDAACGAMKWQTPLMRQIKKDIPWPIDYVGVDIVDDLVEHHQHILFDIGRFYKCDITLDPLPKGVDLVICRDVLFHFSLPKIVEALRNILASGAKYLLTTSFDSKTIAFSMDFNMACNNINFHEPPFSFGHLAIESWDERLELFGISGGRHLLLFDLDNLRSLDWSAIELRAKNAHRHSRGK